MLAFCVGRSISRFEQFHWRDSSVRSSDYAEMQKSNFPLLFLSARSSWSPHKKEGDGWSESERAPFFARPNFVPQPQTLLARVGLSFTYVPRT